MEHEFRPVFESGGQLLVLQQAALNELDPLVLGQVPFAGGGKVI